MVPVSRVGHRGWVSAEAPGGEAPAGPPRDRRSEEPDGEHGTRRRGLSDVRRQKQLHALSVDEFPAELFVGSWANREPPQLDPKPAIDGPVLVHGDACAPITLIGADNTWAGHVDLGDLTVGDRWADLAVASMSLKWNYTPPLEELFWSTYGVRPDEERIRYYRALWVAES